VKAGPREHGQDDPIKGRSSSRFPSPRVRSLGLAARYARSGSAPKTADRMIRPAGAGR